MEPGLGSSIGQNSNTNNEHGIIWVKDGNLFVKDPYGNGNFPTVTPCDGIELLINGIRIEEKTTVAEKDIIELKTETIEEEQGMYKLTITPDGLSAALDVQTSTVRRQYVQDSEPVNDLALVLSSKSETVCPFTFDEIMLEIAKKNTTYGLKQYVIQQLLAQPESGRYIIAEGDPPGETIDEKVEIIAKEKSSKEKIDDKSLRVDFRNMFEILSVEQGELLAVKHPGKQGNPGKKVTNEPIIPAMPLVYELSAGNGTEIIDDGFKVTAKISGSPIVRKLGNKYIVDIKPAFKKNGDVDLASGNIRFKGDVVVTGNVCEGMSVQASGKVDISGMIFEANISALEGINAKQNITGSNLMAGGNKALYGNFFKTLDPIYSDLTEITKVLPSLAKHPQLQNVKTGQLIQVLIDKKYPRLPSFINDLMKFAEGGSFGLPQEITELIEDIDKHIRGLNLLRLESVDLLLGILQKIAAAQEAIAKIASKKSDIFFPYAVNSKIESSGNVTVNGGGCINTIIRAGGKVNIAGVFRGGEIFANNDVSINEAGSELGAKTLIRVNEKRKVYLNKAYEGVRIQIGDRQLTFHSMQNNIKAELNKDGAISVTANTRKPRNE